MGANKGDYLTAKQEKFCYEYSISLNATDAALKAGYSKDTAGSIGQQNMAKPHIRQRIEAMKKDAAETMGITRNRILQEHMKIAYSSIAHLHRTWITLKEFEELTPDEKASIKSISTKVLKQNIGTQKDPVIVDVEYVKIELFDKQKALDAISNMLGFNAPVEHSITPGSGLNISFVNYGRDSEPEQG